MSRSSIAWFDKVFAVWLNSLYMCRMPQLVPFCSNTSASRKQSECRPSKLSERQAQGMIGHICLATSIESTSNITEGSGDRDARSIHARSPAYSATLLLALFPRKPLAVAVGGPDPRPSAEAAQTAAPQPATLSSELPCPRHAPSERYITAFATGSGSRTSA